MRQIFVVRRYEYDAAKGKGFSVNIKAFYTQREAEAHRDTLKAQRTQEGVEYYIMPQFTNLYSPEEL